MGSSTPSTVGEFSSTADAPAALVDPAEIVDRIGHFRSFLVGLAERLVSRELRTRLAASDVVQMTLLTAIRDHTRFRGASEHALREWLVTILRHRIVDESRRVRGCQKRDWHRDQPLGELQPRSPVRGPASEVMVREQITCLLDAIEALDPLGRAIVRARYLEDQSFEQIGERLGMSHDAARRRWLKAMQAIGRRLGRESFY